MPFFGEHLIRMKKRLYILPTKFENGLQICLLILIMMI